ncbi:hypothetical protein BHM03_00003448 [Ensete ventricosum]|nr:hypothetical protein BHM03_00003448 [Ensete ventricosum]
MAEGCVSGTIELKMAEGHVSGTTELMMAERYVSGTTELTMAKRCVSGTIELKMTEGHVSGSIELMMAERHVSGTTELMTTDKRVMGMTELMMAEGCVSGIIELKMAERHVSGTTELMMTERHVSGMTELMMAERRVSGMTTLTMLKGPETLLALMDSSCFCLGFSYFSFPHPPLSFKQVRCPPRVRLVLGSFPLPVHRGRSRRVGRLAFRDHHIRGYLLRRTPGREGTWREPEVLADSSLTYRRPKSMRDMCGIRVREDDEGYYVLQMADWAPRDSSAAMWARGIAPDAGQGLIHLALEGPYCPSGKADCAVGELEADNAKLKSGLDELSGWLDEADKELNELWEGLVESQRQLKEQKVDRRKADDEPLKLMRENESLKAELPGKSIADYKQSVGFGWGLQRMGQVSYEYGYRVALARFQAWYPDLEVDNDPFTERPEDGSVPMKTHQEFDDSIPPEE